MAINKCMLEEQRKASLQGALDDDRMSRLEAMAWCGVHRRTRSTGGAPLPPPPPPQAQAQAQAQVQKQQLPQFHRGRIHQGCP